MSVFSDRRPLRSIGGLRAYLRQVEWSLRWRLRLRARVAGRRAGPGPRAASSRGRARLARSRRAR